MRFNPDGTRIVTASADGTAKIWDSATGEQLVTLEPPTREGFVNSMSALMYPEKVFAAFNLDGRSIETVSISGAGRKWDTIPWKEQDLPGHASLGWTKRLRLWQVERLRSLETGSGN